MYNILQIVPRMAGGGVERGTAELATYLADQGWGSFVACEPGGTWYTYLKSKNVTVLSGPFASKNPVVMWQNRKKLLHWIDTYAIDLLHVRSRAPAWTTFWVAKAKNIPWVTTYHGTYRASNTWKKAYNRVMTYGDSVIAPSHCIRKHVETQYPETTSMVHVVSPSIDTEIFALKREDAWEARHHYGWDKDDRVCLLMGRWSHWKGQAFLLSLLSQVDDRIKVLLVGHQEKKDTAYGQRVKALAVSLGNRVRWEPYQADPRKFYALADCVLVPSLEPEAFGRVMVEALGMGTYVLAADHGGAQEIVMQGGERLTPGCKASWIRALNRIAGTSRVRLNQWGKEGRQDVTARYGKNQFSQKTLALYQDLLTRSTSKP